MLRLKNKITLPEDAKQIKFNLTINPLSLVVLTTNANILVYNLKNLDGLLTLNLNGILSTFKTKISCFEYDLSHSLLFLGSESGKIYVCNKSVLDIQSNKKMKSVPNVQE